MYCDKKVLQKYKYHSDYFISFHFIQTELCSINKIQHYDKKPWLCLQATYSVSRLDSMHNELVNSRPI